jgi:hypothetical protein
VPLIDSDSVVDEGGDEALHKRLKRLEDQLKKANDSNKTLMVEVKSLKKKPAPPRNRVASDDDDASRSNGNKTGTSDSDSDGNSNIDSDTARRSDDPALLFSSRMVSVLVSMLYMICGQLILTDR